MTDPEWATVRLRIPRDWRNELERVAKENRLTLRDLFVLGAQEYGDQLTFQREASVLGQLFANTGSN